MTLRTSEAIFRLLVGIALAVGFVGFITHSHETHRPARGMHVQASHAPAHDTGAPAVAEPALVASVPTDVPVGL